ncbi:DNA polymerase III subunit delta [Cyanobacterium aponinum]|uniref:DNA polymerase III subunit delta n=1 Tax=Cyanobacterium aponinum (strain PCC 10605) TaxID=755178 RepID=K9Z1E0_CYAAP|nr:DNA polymerase III subunit delta [Cyanobacterium aponinum]AFZ53021.1 DNA polymerase III, delta subunit [Cyanobacterium aponinum PCC 10605]
MPIYYFWGDDDFTMMQEINALKEKNLDLNWLQFNFEKFAGDKEEFIREAFLQAMTPPFGSGDRIVWLVNTTICQSCSEDLLTEIQRTIKQIPDTTHLLLTSEKKPDGRIKSTKLVNQYAQVKEFSLIPPWQTDILIKKVEGMVAQKELKITKEGIKILANCVGNDSRLLWQELDKLSLYQGENKQPINEEIVKSLVNVSNQNSLQLAQAILQQNIPLALQLVQDLISLNEPALRIVATLVGQFRTWAIVKTMVESGEKDEKAIAENADISNPKRIYFLKQETKNISAQKLLSSLPILLELEANLKSGHDPLIALETKIIQLCTL